MPSSRRDGSCFINLLMIAPLCDSRGQIRYHIGAQVDVSGLVKDCTDLESFQQLAVEQDNRQESNIANLDRRQEKKDEFQEVCDFLLDAIVENRTVVSEIRLIRRKFLK